MSTSPSYRLPGYDLARALAVLGMVLVNFTSMMEVGVFSPAWLKPVVDFIYGRAAVVFVVLAGVSVSQMYARCGSPEAIRTLQRRLLKRSLLLLIAGLLLWRWWPADILHFYAVFIAAGAWAVTWRRAYLKILTVMIIGISLPVCATLTSAYDLGDPIFTPDPHRADLVLLMDFVTSPYYALFPWLGFFLIGVLLGHREPFSGSFCRRLGLMGTATCLAVEIFSAVMMGWIERQGLDIEGNWWITFLRSEAFPVTPLFILSAAAGAVALISLCRMASDNALRRFRGMHALTALGRFSLTLYAAHIGWGLLFKQWVGGLGTGINSHQMLLAVATFDLAGILFTLWWCRYFRRGPLEMLFYRLTVGSAPRVDRPATSGTFPGGTPLPQ